MRADHVAPGPQLSMRRAASVTLGEPRKATARRVERFETFISRDSLPYFDTRPLQEILDEAEGACEITMCSLPRSCLRPVLHCILYLQIAYDLPAAARPALAIIGSVSVAEMLVVKAYDWPCDPDMQGSGWERRGWRTGRYLCGHKPCSCLPSGPPSYCCRCTCRDLTCAPHGLRLVAAASTATEL